MPQFSEFRTEFVPGQLNFLDVIVWPFLQIVKVDVETLFDYDDLKEY